jgi:hypothetical protein
LCTNAKTNAKESRRICFCILIEILSLFLPHEYKYKSRRICLQNLPIINMPNTIVFALEAGEVGHNQPGSEEEAARQERAATAEAARRKKACRETC